MDVTLSNNEVRLIAAEVVRQLGEAGLTLRAPNGASARGVGEPPDGNRLLGIEAAADAVSQHPNTIRRHIRSGRLKARMINRSYKIRQRDLDRYAAS